MQIDLQLTRERIGLGPCVLSEPVVDAGAWVEFRGVVRGHEDGQPITAIEYEAYPEMAIRQLRRILEELKATHPCLVVQVVHRLGLVPVGETAIYVRIAGKHRAEAFAMLAGFMDRLKQDVPIWKVRAVAMQAARDLQIAV